MTTTKYAENLQQYKSWFSMIVTQVLAFTWTTNLVRELVSKFQMNCIAMFYVIDNSNSDR